MEAARLRECTWCGAQVSGAGEGPVYCCSGCETAAALVTEAGLSRWFEERDQAAPRPEGSPLPVLAVQDLGGLNRVDFRVDGLRCASCVWLCERVLERSPGVDAARVSYGDGSASITWDPERAELASLLSGITALGYSVAPLGARRRVDGDLLRRFGLAAFAAMNTMAIAAAVYLGWLSGMDEATAALFRWIQLALATPVALWSAAPFFRSAWVGLKNRTLHMDLPIALAVGVLYSHSLWEVTHGRDGWLDTLTMLVALLLGGRVVEQSARRRVLDAADGISGWAQALARRIVDGRIEEIPAGELQIGDLVEVASGEELPADLHELEGQGRVDVGILTGESRPVQVVEGGALPGGAVLIEGHLQGRVERLASQSAVARMAGVLEQLRARPEPVSLADRIAPVFTSVVLTLAVAGGIAWGVTSGVDAGIRVAIAVLVVACPCALALAAPLSNAVGLGEAAKRGLLLRSPAALRELGQADKLAIDKTGTLTLGRPRVVSADNEVLRLAAGVERASAHPLARAIVREATERQIPIPLGTDIEEQPGVGISGVVEGQSIVIRGAGPGVVEVVGHGEIVIADRLRGDALEAVQALRAVGLEPVVLSGDHPVVVWEIASALGLKGEGSCLPESKAARLRAWSGTTVFLGDGLNDGPALAEASVGLVMAEGAGACVAAADGVVRPGALGAVASGVLIGRGVERATRRNLVFSLLYNLGAVGLALAGLVNPLVAAVLMPASSLGVLLGALSVRRAA